jgi:hypothetical protein
MVLHAAARAVRMLMRGVDPETVTYEDLHLRHLELIAAHAMLCSTVPCSVPPHTTCAKCVDIKTVEEKGMVCLCPTVRGQILRLPEKLKPREVGRSGWSETDQFAGALDKLVEELGKAHANDAHAFRALVSELVARTKPQYKTRKRDDGRMTMGEEPVHVKRMRAAQEAETQAATQARREAEKNEFLQGAKDPARSTGVATCCEELLFVVQRQKRKMIPVHRWSAQVMGAAAKTLNDIMEIEVVYLGDCGKFEHLPLRRTRTSADLARHYLKYFYEERMKRGAYEQKSDARKALEEELGGIDSVCFVDARFLPFRDHDWDEAAKIAKACKVTFVISIGSLDDSPSVEPLQRPGEVSATRHTTKPSVRTGPSRLDLLRTAITGMLDEYKRSGATDMEKLERLVCKLEKYPRCEQTQEDYKRKDAALDILERAGEIVPSSDVEESDSETE